MPGVNYGKSIIDGINACRLMLLVWSSSSNGSQQVEPEVERAVSKGMTIIPFRIENVVPSGPMEYFLSAPHWLDALTKPLETYLERLSLVVRAVLDADREPRTVETWGFYQQPVVSSPPAGSTWSQRPSDALRHLASATRWFWRILPRPVRLIGLMAALVAFVVY
jgi:hypothetical protein